jgi:hypothetical protein
LEPGWLPRIFATGTDRAVDAYARRSDRLAAAIVAARPAA